MLERGGNAFDAAVAAAFALQVLEPHSNGPASDVSIIAYSARDRASRSICGQGPMPASVTRSHFHDLGLGQVPGSGLLPATVPGAFGAWLRLLAEFGTMRLADVLDHAIGYAVRGFPLLPPTAQAIEVMSPLFTAEWTSSAAAYMPGGKAPAAGSRFTNLLLAQTYERIVRLAEQTSSSREGQIEAAHDVFYRGFVAERVDDFVRVTPVLDATGRRHRGFLTGQDLADWRPEVAEPTSGDYGDYRVCKPGPWSQGPVFLQQLTLLDGFDLEIMGLNSADYIHTIVECAKLAFADREAWYGDPDHFDVPLKALLSHEYGENRRALVGDGAASRLRPGSPDGREPWIPAPGAPDLQPDAADWLAQLGSGLPTVVRASAARSDTCCVTAADRNGNIVAATPSGGWLKSSPVVPGLGFPLGTRGQTMWLVDGHPNSLAPGRRPRTTLSPTVVLRDGSPLLAFGTPGGDQQDQWTLLFFLAVVRFGLDTQAATESLAFHCDAMPASFTPRENRPRGVVIERNCDSSVVDELRSRGHDVALVPELSLGKVCATGFVPDEGFVRAAASPRGRQAYAASR